MIYWTEFWYNYPVRFSSGGFVQRRLVGAGFNRLTLNSGHNNSICETQNHSALQCLQIHISYSTPSSPSVLLHTCETGESCICISIQSVSR